MTADEQGSATDSGGPLGPWVLELQEWRLNVERASRRNRNLLQYAAGIAALLGIGAGSGGVFALAEAVKPGVPLLAPDFVRTALGVGIVASALLLLGLLVNFVGRWRAETEADRHLRRLIEARPDHFLPRKPE